MKFREDNFSKPFIQKQKEFNFELNNYIFQNFLFLKPSYNGFADQFITDFFNYFLQSHYNDRITIFKITRYIGKPFFIFFSFLDLFRHAFMKFIMGFSHNLNYFDTKNIDINTKNIIICFGFPDYSFSFQQNSNYASSFAEFLMLNNLINSDDKLLSIDEYIRPSRKKENKEIKFPERLNRIIINKRRNYKSIIEIPRYLFESFKEFKKRFSTKSFLLFFFYYEKYSKAKLIEDLIKQIGLGKIKETYALSLYDIGVLKYQNNFMNINFFNYSQNCFIPPSTNIYDRILNKSENKKLNLLLEEITFNIFSMYHNNQINLNYHLRFLNSVITKIKNEYGVSLQKSNIVTNLVDSNLGFERIKKIKLKSESKNVLLFDIPIESINNTLRRQFTGDFFATKTFMEEFYKEILEISNNCKINLFLKPKYSISKKSISNFYTNLFNQLSIKNFNFEIIDPYDKIDIGEKKFDLMINLPYTSTYYTLRSLTKRNVYYVPLSYLKYFDDIGSNFMDYNELSNLLKN